MTAAVLGQSAPPPRSPLLLAIYNRRKTDLVLSVRRYSIPRRVRRREPRGAALRTGCKSMQTDVFVCGFVYCTGRLCEELFRKLARFYLFLYWFFVDFRRFLCARERSWLLMSTRHSGALGQRSGRDSAPAAARRRRPPEGGRAQGRAEVLNPPKCFVL